MVNKILFITLSNIGDVILTLPVLDALKEEFPQAKVTVLVGPRPKEIFRDNPYINRLVVYDKHSKLKEKINLVCQLKKEKFDLVVDLRNSLFGMFILSRFKTSPFLFIPKNIRHMKERHLYRLPKVAKGCQGLPKVAQNKSLYISPSDEECINQILKQNGIGKEDRIVVISPGARSHIKRWPREKFAELIRPLINEFGVKIILVGDKDDIPIARHITTHCGSPVIDLSGKTSISQLAHLLKDSSLLITNDSAVLHIASYLNKPIIAIFGPTNEIKYGPWSDTSFVVKKDIFCRPCQKAQCKFRTLECMRLVKVDDVLMAVRKLFVPRPSSLVHRQRYKRILIVRTDRIGDVLLSTPAIKALRDAYPNAYIAMMVSPYAKDIVEGNTFLDEVIIYDKDGFHKNWYRSLKFARNLRKKRFDLAVILHPANRAHLITYFSGIPRRVGYDLKLGFLLTDKIKHTKQLGEKHELEYTLDLIRRLGIEPKDKSLFMPIRPESEAWVEELFKERGINKQDRLLAIHPAASCISKIWPLQKFADAADKLIEKYGFKVLIISGPKDTTKAQEVSKRMRHPVINLGGMTSVSQLASLLKKCQLFISNDSGPVHIASSVGTPVISIFGRSQKGLSPTRWGPTGKHGIIAHKTVGCVECLAHNCIRGFICLDAVTVDYILNLADIILKG